MLSLPLILQGWTKKAEQIHCPAPLPEEPAVPLLTKMLVPAPYKVPKKTAEKEAKKTRGGLRRRGTSGTISEGSNARSASEEDEEEEEDESRRGEERRGRPPYTWRPSRLKGEKLFFRKSPLPLPIAARCGILGPSP